MKVLVTGATGQLGQDVMQELERRGHQRVGTYHRGQPSGEMAGDYLPMDIVDAARVEEVIGAVRPDAVVHCAAWTDVDAAQDAPQMQKVFAVNVNGTRNVAKACQTAGSKMLYLSTDYVFDGRGSDGWKADSSDFGPLNLYGATKLQGEFAVRSALERYFIVRVSWVFGSHGKNFVRTMLEVGKTKRELRVVNDQIGAPTYTRDLARLLVDMAETQRYGCYHAANEGGYISWYDFACEIFKQAGYAVQVQGVTTQEYGLCRAQRPLNSRLDTQKLRREGFAPLPDWQDALRRCLREMGIAQERGEVG